MSAAPKLKFRQSSLKWLLAIDEYVRRYSITNRDSLEHAPSDVLDGWAVRSEVDDLVRRRILRIDRLSPSEKRGAEYIDRNLCGWTWTVAFTQRALNILYPVEARS